MIKAKMGEKMEFRHYSVMADEAIEALGVRHGGVYVDGTLGGGGHAARILEKGGRLVGIDRDPDAIKAAKERLGIVDTSGNFVQLSFRKISANSLSSKSRKATKNLRFLTKPNFSKIFSKIQSKQVTGGVQDGVSIICGNFDSGDVVLDELGIDEVDGVLLDLGVSSYQLDNAERGFSYMADGALDMRMGDSGKSAADVVNGYDEGELARILREYGEERFAKRIARRICAARPIGTTMELVDVIKSAVPRADKHPAMRSFQAIRIEVNDELGSLGKAIEAYANRLKAGGRLVIITFHSLEDRIVKVEFERLAGGECTCPRGLPVCACGLDKGNFKVITKRPIVPGERELAENSRSASAKLRVLERC